VGEVRVGASAQLREDPWAGPEHADHLLVNALIEDYRVELAG
jgi:phosphoribosylformylglycinamidine (FGAM) synthase PurS component